MSDWTLLRTLVGQFCAHLTKEVSHSGVTGVRGVPGAPRVGALLGIFKVEAEACGRAVVFREVQLSVFMGEQTEVCGSGREPILRGRGVLEKRLTHLLDTNPAGEVVLLIEIDPLSAGQAFGIKAVRGIDFFLGHPAARTVIDPSEYFIV